MDGRQSSNRVSDVFCIYASEVLFESQFFTPFVGGQFSKVIEREFEKEESDFMVDC